MYRWNIDKELQNILDGLAIPSYWTQIVKTELGGYEYSVKGDTLSLDLPGFKKGDVTIKTNGDTLTVSAKNAKRQFERSFQLEGVPSGAEATLEDGVLTVKMQFKKSDLDIVVK